MDERNIDPELIEQLCLRDRELQESKDLSLEVSRVILSCRDSNGREWIPPGEIL